MCHTQGTGRSYTWLKWTAGALLFVEGLVGVALPALMKLSTRTTWLISVLNVFSGGVFLTFGALLAPSRAPLQGPRTKMWGRGEHRLICM